jgi:Predicted esterase of the alpha-beta hydrolase superfamily
MISGAGAGAGAGSATTSTTIGGRSSSTSSSSTIGSGDRKRPRPAAQQESQFTTTNVWNPKDMQETDSKKAKHDDGDAHHQQHDAVLSAAAGAGAAKRILRPAPFLDDIMIHPRKDDHVLEVVVGNKDCKFQQGEVHSHMMMVSSSNIVREKQKKDDFIVEFQTSPKRTKNPVLEHPSNVTTTSEQHDDDDDDDTRSHEHASKFALLPRHHNDYKTAKDDIYMDHEIDDCHYYGGEGRTECTTVLQASSSSLSSSRLKVIIMMFAMFVSNIAMTISLLDYFLTPSTIAHSQLRGPPRHHPHVIPPSQTLYYATAHWKKKSFWTNAASSACHDESLLPGDQLSNVTLRQFLSHPDGFHLGIAPAFFGFYVYFGALTALSEHVLTESDEREGRRKKILLPIVSDGSRCRMKRTPCMDYCLPDDGNATTPTTRIEPPLLKSVAGASAGAMAAVLLAAGLNPRDSAEFASGLSVDKFWDFPGLGGILKGQLFEEIMVQRLKESWTKMGKCGEFDNDDIGTTTAAAAAADAATTTMQLEDGLIPVAVTAFDVFNLQNIVLTKGCMGKAARASATFPLLFQPCAWMMVDSSSSKEEEEIHSNDSSASATGVKPSKYRYLIDGGLWDPYGLEGLGHLRLGEKKKRIVNMVAGSYGIQGPRGPSKLTMIDGAEQVVSISIENTPRCGPWAMKNGPRAVEAAMNAVISVLDVPMY